jgi:hypothetical protein
MLRQDTGKESVIKRISSMTTTSSPAIVYAFNEGESSYAITYSFVGGQYIYGRGLGNVLDLQSPVTAIGQKGCSGCGYGHGFNAFNSTSGYTNSTTYTATSVTNSELG